MVPQPERHVRVHPFVQAARRTEQHASRQEAVAADGDGGGARGRGGRGRGGGADEIAADHDFGLDDGFAAQHDVLGADEDGFAGDFVACVLEVVRWGGRGNWVRRGDVRFRCSRLLLGGATSWLWFGIVVVGEAAHKHAWSDV